MTERLQGPSHRISTIPGLILGLGFGGFVDGIALHQIAQWHNMGSAVLPPTTMDAMKQNMTWDGYFHIATLVLSILGVFLMLRDAHRGMTLPSAGTFTGQLMLGWGLFNLVEGSVDHHLLDLHHVRDMPVHVPLYDVSALCAPTRRARFAHHGLTAPAGASRRAAAHLPPTHTSSRRNSARRGIRAP